MINFEFDNFFPNQVSLPTFKTIVPQNSPSMKGWQVEKYWYHTSTHFANIETFVLKKYLLNVKKLS